MKYKIVIIALLLAAGITTAQAQANADLRDAITRAQANFSSYFEQGNLTALSAMYSLDAEIVAPDGTVFRGRDSIRGFWQAFRDGGYKKFEVRNTEIAGAGSGFGYSVGTCSGTRPDGIIEQRRYLVIWKKEGSNWLIFRAISSSPIGS